MYAPRLQVPTQTLRLQRPAVADRRRSNGFPALADEAIDWGQVPLTDLVAHMLSAHHAELREVLGPLTERTARMIDEVPAHAEPARMLHSLLTRLDLHMRKLEQLIYPLLRRIDAGGPGAYLLPSLIGADALDLVADAAGLEADLVALRHLARFCPHPGTIETARKLDDRARRFLRLEAEILLPRASQLAS